jgi:hypothetical protein
VANQSAIASGFTYTIGNIITIGATNVSIGKFSNSAIFSELHERGIFFFLTLFLLVTALSIGSLLKIVFHYELSDVHLLVITLLITIIQTVLNCHFMGVLSWLNKLNVFWSCAGLFLVVMILSLFATTHRDPHWVFTNYQNRTGFDNPYYVFILGMVGATYTLFGKLAGSLFTDHKASDSSNAWYSLGAECSASMSEETENADITSPM